MNMEGLNEDEPKGSQLNRRSLLFDPSSSIISHRTNSFRSSKGNEGIPHQRVINRQLWVITLVTFASLAFVYAMVYVVNEFVIYARHPDYNTRKPYKDLDNPYEDIIQDTIPFVQDWYREFQTDPGSSLFPPIQDRINDDDGINIFGEDDCLEQWFEDLQNAIKPVDGEELFTSPKIIERTLESMGLSEQLPIRKHLSDLLHEPQSFTPLLDSSFQCLVTSEGIKRLACEARNIYTEKLNFTTTEEHCYIIDSLHVALVIDRLTAVLMTDLPLLIQVASTMQTSQLQRFGKWVEQQTYSRAERNYILSKYHGTALTLERFAKTLATNDISTQHATLAINVLEAVKLDILTGHEANAKVGMALATSVTFGPTVNDHRLYWKMGQDWVDAYMAWNTAFLMGSSSPILSLPQVMIPSVSCTLTSKDGEDFVAAHVISLSLFLMQIKTPLQGSNGLHQPGQMTKMKHYYYAQRASGTIRSEQRMELTSALGEANCDGLVISSPSTDQVDKMLFTLCGGKCYPSSWKGANSNSIATLSDEEFHVYLGFLLWVTVLLAGLGLEMIVLLGFLQDGWSTKTEILWRFAQFLFPLLVATTLGLAIRGNYLTLPLMVASLWKFGFPETIMYFYSALFPDESKKKSTLLVRICDFINGVGLVVHHGSSSFCMVMILVGVIKPEKNVINPVLILLMQHWFVLLHYINNFLYTLITLVLEVWFEWVVISELEEIYANHWTAAHGCGCLLAAHWMWIPPAAYELYCSTFADSKHSQASEREAFFSGFVVSRRTSNGSSLSGLTENVSVNKEEEEVGLVIDDVPQMEPVCDAADNNA